MDEKIKEHHLNRDACVYVRQSTREQVEKHPESIKLQCGLEKRAREFGWNNVRIIDEDLGKTGSGEVERSGFARLLLEVCDGKIGAVFALEASRLARNGREWHTLLEMCGHRETLIIDHSSVYNPQHPDDRLLLGMKGSISEMELNTLRVRLLESIKQKAARGEYFNVIAVGYVRVGKDAIEKDPDIRVQEAIKFVFDKFREFLSIRQVKIWFNQEKIKLPVVVYEGGERRIAWELPGHNTIRSILVNPVYAGAYSYGKTGTEIRIENGVKRKIRGKRKERKDWILLVNRHEGYITWEEHEHFMKIIEQNAGGARAKIGRGATKKGSGLLSGLLRCGHCGRKLYTHYSPGKGSSATYMCRMRGDGGKICTVISGFQADRAVSETVLDVLSPTGAEAACEAMRRMTEKRYAIIRNKEMEIEQARYEAGRARRQYDRVDPENRLVASELERRWNEALRAVNVLEEELHHLKSEHAVNENMREEEFASLCEDLNAVWNHPRSDVTIKKNIIRTVIKEIIVSIRGNTVRLVVHWEGDDHTEIVFQKRNVVDLRKTSEATEKIIKELSRYQTDEQIAFYLNRLGKKTAEGHSWTRVRVTSFRNKRDIDAFRKGEIEERGEVLSEQAAEILNVSRDKIYELIKRKILPAFQVCPGTPWVIQQDDLKREEVVNVLRYGKSSLPNEEELLF